MREKAAPSIPFLIGILNDGETLGTQRPGEITTPAIKARVALAKVGRPAVELLITALKDKELRIRYGAAETLGEIKDGRAVEPLIATLNDENRIVRQRAAEALGKIKDNRALKPLIAALKDEDTSVRQWVAWALKEITRQELGEDSEKWQKWLEKNKK